MNRLDHDRPEEPSKTNTSNHPPIRFEDLFDIQQIQQLQDQFAEAVGLASIITRPDGSPITRPSRFCRLCQDIIRKTDAGRLHCQRSDAKLGGGIHADGPVIQPCLSGGLWDAGASISAGGQHIASWLIGQVRDENHDESHIIQHARDIGADEKDTLSAFREVPVMSRSRFQSLAQMLFTMAQQLSHAAYQNLQKERLILEQQQAEKNLRERESLLNAIVDTAKDSIFIKDTALKYTRVNPAMTALFGVPAEEILGKTDADLFGADVAEHIDAVDQRVLRGESIEEFPSKPVCGEMRHFHTIKVPIRDDQGVTIGLCGIARDVTDRRQAEEDLRQSQELLASIVENIPVTVFLKDAAELRFVLFNRTAEQTTGIPREQLIGKNDYDFVPKEQADHFTQTDREVLRGGKLVEISEEELTTPHRQQRILRTRKIPIMNSEGEPEYLLGISEDITNEKRQEEERARLQNQLVHAQRIESIGRLAGGVAHDFNNVLGAILSYTELALDKVTPDCDIHHYLEEIHKATLRSADLTRQLLAFARKQAIAPKVLDLNVVVEEILSMLRRLIGEHISLVWRPASGLWPVNVDPTQIYQILTNLCVNARDAIDDVGQIIIETRNVTFDGNETLLQTRGSHGDHVMLSVQDDGCGMDQDTLVHLFEPFFTTKPMGQGTGLGLATVYGIARQNHGFVDAHSEPSRGSLLRVFFPRHQPQPEASHSCEDPRDLSGGNETILLVEDEPSLLNAVATMIRQQGYTVLTASHPEQALKLAETHQGPIHLLITDVVMPEMNGRDLANTLKARDPNLKRLFMSGYTHDLADHPKLSCEGVSFIQKPFSRRDICAKVREILGHS